jgi:adenylate kinase family enzyme
MIRVAVVGSGGAGKSTFARRLGERLGLPVIHLDEHYYWQPGWVATPTDEWRARQRELIAGERWIVDGNYSSTLDLRLERADTVIVLALPRWRCLLGVIRRWLKYHGRDVQAAGCPERVTLAFLRWVWNYPTTGRARLTAALTAHAGDQTRVIEIQTPVELRAFLADPLEHPATTRE